MENSIKALTIGGVAITGIIIGGMWAALAECFVALTYILIKNC